MPAERVVVTGLGVVASNARGAAAFENALRQGKSGIAHVDELRASNFACQVAGIPTGIDAIAIELIAEADRIAMNSNMTYAAIAAIDAWTDAGLPVLPQESNDVHWDAGAIIGTAAAGIETVAGRLVPGTDAKRVARLGSTLGEQTMASGNTARIAGILGLGAQVSTNSSACTSGTEAVVDAFHLVRDGRARRMLAGGSEGHSKYFWAAFDAMRLLCRSYNAEPERASRPMSATAGGFVPAAGAGILLLESLSSARERGARIYAEVLGGAVNCGGHRRGGTMTAQNPEGVRRCIRSAVAASGLEPSEVDLINGHLTATGADTREVQAWSDALGLSPDRMPLVQATKSLVGHGLGAAGGIECVASVLQIARGFVHGSLNCEDLHPALAPYAARIPRATLDASALRVVAKASFGFGDVNACVLFRRFEGGHLPGGDHG